MSSNTFRRSAAAAAGLAIIGTGLLGAGIASAAGGTTAPAPGAVCGVTSMDGTAPTTVPCPAIPSTAERFTIGSDGTVRDGAGNVVARVDPKTGKVVEIAPGTPPRTGGAVAGAARP